MSLRTRLLFGIVAANLAAFAVLALVVHEDAARRERERIEHEQAARSASFERNAELIGAFLVDLDFSSEGFAEAVQKILHHPVWRSDAVRDAYVKEFYQLDRPFAGDFGLNLTGYPNADDARSRSRNRLLVEEAFSNAVPAAPVRVERLIRRHEDVVAIPLFRGENRERWGAAYVRLSAPESPSLPEPLTLRDVALAMGGATLAGMGLVFLLLHVLVLHPLDRIAQAAARVSRGDFRTEVARTGRGDEIDELIDAFNAMQREIGQSREALERRVEEAVRRMRETEKRLVLNERMAAVGTLAAGIAHEINNPLGGMINAARALRRRGALNEAQGRFLDLIEDGLDRVRDLVSRVLRFSRKGPATEAVDLESVIDDAVRFVRHRAVERSVVLDVDVGDSPRVRAEAAALGQVFLNLLLNALDAAPAGSGRIRVRASRGESGVHVEVADNGVGMGKEELGRAFDHFYTTKETGTGLGLSIVHQIVSELGGSVAIDSEKGRGTTVRVVLPAEEPAGRA